MARKITFLCGSPRKEGNTNRVVGWVAEAARAAGAEVEIIDLPKLNYKTNGCTACMGCKQGEEFRCVIEDEASPILARLPESDAVVFATPVYWLGPSAQLKVFTDRMFSLAKFDESGGFRTPFKPGTVFAVIATAGGGLDDGLRLVEQTFRQAAEALGLGFESLLVPHAPMDPGELESRSDVREKAASFGRKLAGV